MKHRTIIPRLLGVAAVVACGAAGPSLTAAPSAEPAAQVRHVDPAAAARLIQEKKVIVLDIRTPEEFKTGHIAGATNLDFNAADFARKLEQLDKGKSYLIHCASGRRSTSSLETFTKLKFRSIIHLDGGLKAWQKAGKPVEK